MRRYKGYRGYAEAALMVASPGFAGTMAVSWGWILFNSVSEPGIPGILTSVVVFVAAGAGLTLSFGASEFMNEAGIKGWHVSLGHAAFALTLLIITVMLCLGCPVLLFAALPAMAHVGYLLALVFWLAPFVLVRLLIADSQ